MRLNVFVAGKKVGELFERAGDRPEPNIVFRYLDDVKPADAISITMPVSKKEYEHHRLHPIFDMILPEGQRRIEIEKAGKLIRVDDLGLLALVGSNTVGRVQSSEAEHPDMPLDVSRNLLLHSKDSDTLFHELLEASNYAHGVAGVQPKLLDRSTGEEVGEVPDPRTVVGSTEIVKTFEDEFSYSTINEAICLETAAAAGMEVPTFQLSDDAHLLIIDRFDITRDGHQLGFEEMATLLGQYAEKKYEGSFEEIATRIEECIDFSVAIDALENLFRQIVFQVLTRNGDAHLKNFGLLYDENQQGQLDYEMAPAYDLLTTTIYIPNDVPALALESENYSKKWWDRDELKAFADRHCYLTSKQVDKIINEVGSAIIDSMVLIDDYASRFPGFAGDAEKMKAEWCKALQQYDFDISDDCGQTPR